MVFGSGNKFRIRRSQSSLRREPREREKGVPNFEGSYKRTMSPSPSVTSLTSGFSNGSISLDERLEDKECISDDRKEIPSKSFLKTEGGSLFYVNNETNPKMTEYARTLPRNYVLGAQPADVKRAVRAPRTQSDPVGVNDQAAQLCQLGSQNNMGSTESGYSSLSLNNTSPYVSPTGSWCSQMRESAKQLKIECSMESVIHGQENDVDDSAQKTKNTDLDVKSEQENTRFCCQEIQCDIEQKEVNHVEQSLLENGNNIPITELVSRNRIHKRMSDAASQTDLGTILMAEKEKSKPVENVCRLPTQLFGKQYPEEIEFEKLCRQFVNMLPPAHKLRPVLVPETEIRKSMDYIWSLFQSNYSAHCQTTSFATENDEASSSCSRDRLQNDNISNEDSDGTDKAQALSSKKKEVLACLDRKLWILREEQAVLVEEMTANERLGESVSEKVVSMASAQELSKLSLHVQEIGHITSLLLSLSSRLAKLDNTLTQPHLFECSHIDKTTLISRKEKLSNQLEEARILKRSIDRRGQLVSGMLSKYLSQTELAEYEYFVHHKSKLLVDARHVADKIDIAERQHHAVVETAV